MSLIQISFPGHNLFAKEEPSECPICHLKIAPVFQHAIYDSPSQTIDALYKCTNNLCRRGFLARYGNLQNDRSVSSHPFFLLLNAYPVTQQVQSFPDPVSQISSQFVAIYNEAYSAEQFDLNEICGVGYRKALEFLIKDYLISRIPSDDPDRASKEQGIKTKALGRCIDEHITDANIKAVAKRATWLGNDETHYVRKWESKDVTDLKKLIQLTVIHMESEALTAQVLADMPEGR